MTTLTRNMRDGEMTLKDGSGTPKTLVLILDEGDLSWEQPNNTIEVKDRGSISDGHTRPGDEESGSLSYSVKMRELLGKSLSAGESYAFYEFINNQGDILTSTSQTGEQFTLIHEFKVTDPKGTKTEKITFGKVYSEGNTISEGNDYNTISFRGRNFEPAPTIARV
jgi:hypothetical protein